MSEADLGNEDVMVAACHRNSAAVSGVVFGVSSDEWLSAMLSVH